MRAVRWIFRLCALVMILLLGACGSSASVSDETAELRAAHATHGSALTPGILTTQRGKTTENPIRLVIPAIGINAFVESVGVRPNGDLATPTQNPWEDVGWDDLGPHPGERGSAVIDGHLDRPGGYPAVFWRLGEMQVGDDVQVTNSAGKMRHFRVTRTAYYTPEEAPLQDIFGNLGGTYLNLITCAGDWIPSQHQTNLRLVVYTALT